MGKCNVRDVGCMNMQTHKTTTQMPQPIRQFTKLGLPAYTYCRYGMVCANNDKIRTYLESISVSVFAPVCYIVGEFQGIGSCFP
jgi:hypothetical protein